jgi:ribosome-binding protein aMBF1 (putative translation factor)
MIKNEHQYEITKAAAEKFESALIRLTESAQQSGSPQSLLWKVQEDALQSQLAQLHFEIEEYELLSSGKQSVLELQSLEELPFSLIKARIAAGLTQKDLANRLGLPEQQVQRYEANDYASANFSRVLEVSRALGIKVVEKFHISVS